MVYELLVSLAEHGTEEYPYSLIFPDSINFTGKMYAFKYSCGALGGVSIADPFQTETTTPTTTAVTTHVSETTTTTVTTTETTASSSKAESTTTSATATAPITTTIPTITTVTVVTVLGDSNRDSKLNVRDAAFIAKMLAQGKASELPPESDFNDDGKINVRDAAAIAKYLASKIK